MYVIRCSCWTSNCLWHLCRVARQVALQHNKLLAAMSSAKLRARQEDELKSLMTEQERRAREFEKVFDVVSTA